MWYKGFIEPERWIRSVWAEKGEKGSSGHREQQERRHDLGNNEGTCIVA